MSDDNDATDCPICLCPITSEPWGVIVPCGHPFHRSCWDQVAANHLSRGGGRRKKKHASCAICNGQTKGFVNVFLDLGRDDDGGGKCSAMTKISGDHEGVVDVDGGDGNLEELAEELWRELMSLCASQDRNENEVGGCVIDVTDSSDRYVEDICSTIDLTQHHSAPPQTSSFDQHDQQRQATLLETEMQKFQQKQGRIQMILKRLKYIHNKILSSSQETQSTPNYKKVQHLKSKVVDLKTTNSSLSSEKKSLQTANEKLRSTSEQLKQTILDRTLECERIRSKFSTLKSQFRSIEDSYKNYEQKSTVAQASLQEKIAILQQELHKMSNQASLDEVHEMDEIRRNYSKMSQQVHDVKAKNARLQKEMGSKEREWEARHGREKEKREGLEKMLGCNNEGVDGSFDAKGATGVEEDSFAWVGRTDKGSIANLEVAHNKTSYGNEKDGHGYARSASTTVVKNDNIGRTQNSSFGRTSITNANMYPHHQAGSSAKSSRSGHHLQKQKSSIAMEALNRASSRKFPTVQELKRPHHQKQKQHWQRQPSSAGGQGQATRDTMPTEGVQLMMRTATRPSQKRRHGGSTISHAQTDDEHVRGKHSRKIDKQGGNQPQIGASTTSKSARKTSRVTVEIGQRGNIATFFKPIVDVDV